MAACAPRRFELVFLDPPFDAGLFGGRLPRRRVAVPAVFVYLEADREFTAAERAPLGLVVHRHLRAGRCMRTCYGLQAQ